MSVISYSSELPFFSIGNDDFLNQMNNNSSLSTFVFNPLDLIHDKYTSELDVNQSSLFSAYQNIPKTAYAYVDSLNLKNTGTSTFSILNMNIRSIPTNLQIFVDSFLIHAGIKIDVLAFTETRLDHDINKLYQLPGYNMFTKSRNRYGGGVALYFSDYHHSTLIEQFCCVESFIECLGVEHIIHNKKYLCICIYRPPGGCMNSFMTVLNDLLAVAYNKQYSSIYLCGDFNVDLVKYKDNIVSDFINLMFSFSLFPLITRPTRITDTTATLLDHVWTSHPELNINNYIIKTDITDHYPVISLFNMSNQKFKSTYIKKRMITEVALNKFANDLSQVTWATVMESVCPNVAYNIFFP